MKKSLKYTITMILSIALIVSLMPICSFAAEKSTTSNDKTMALTNNASGKNRLNMKYGKKSFVDDDEEGDYICWNRPYNFTLYKGEKLKVDFTMYDVWDENWYTIPSFDVMWYREYDDDEPIYSFNPAGQYLIVEPYGFDRYTGYHNIDSKYLLSTRKYYIALTAMPCDEDGYWAENFNDFDIPTEIVFFKVKQLPRPTNVSLKSGKRYVKISFKKSTGAQKYEIYRSTKKNSGYKRIATVSGKTYTNKKLKKGKKYYYKVRAKRGTSTTGIAYSSFTTPKRSKKVK